MSKQYAKVIVNPVAGGHSVYREWPSISKLLTENGLVFDYIHTEGVGHALEIAMAAANTDCQYIVAVGGDGTVNEVANGILNSNGSHNTVLGIVSAGTARSFARSIGIPQDPKSCCKLLTGQNRLTIDVGIVEYQSAGQHLRRFFVNEADLGFGATVVEASKNVPNYFGRKINYLPRVLLSAGALINYKNKRVTLSVEDEAADSCVCSMVVIANGAYFGGGMRVAPSATPNDGLLDMIIFGDMEKTEIMKVWPMIYSGRHIDHQKVSLRKIKRVDIQCDEGALVEADGELLGEGPVSFSVMPSALKIVVGK
ncbi:diacylglycerol/lipid kinase family protein [Chloroflexota bacterium]